MNKATAGIVAILSAAVIYFGSREDYPPGPVDRLIQTENDKALVFAAAVKSTLREPDSFKIDELFVTSAGYTCLAYSARNGFGGMNRQYAVHPDQELEDINQVWSKYCTSTDVRRVK